MAFLFLGEMQHVSIISLQQSTMFTIIMSTYVTDTQGLNSWDKYMLFSIPVKSKWTKNSCYFFRVEYPSPTLLSYAGNSKQ